MTTLAPACIGCEAEMSTEQEPWSVVRWNRAGEGMPWRPGTAFFCPDCEWRIEMFAANVEGEAGQLQDNTPASVFTLFRDDERGES